MTIISGGDSENFERWTNEHSGLEEFYRAYLESIDVPQRRIGINSSPHQVSQCTLPPIAVYVIPPRPPYFLWLPHFIAFYSASIAPPSLLWNIFLGLLSHSSLLWIQVLGLREASSHGSPPSNSSFASNSLSFTSLPPFFHQNHNLHGRDGYLDRDGEEQ